MDIILVFMVVCRGRSENLHAFCVYFTGNTKRSEFGDLVKDHIHFHTRKADVLRRECIFSSFYQHPKSDHKENVLIGNCVR